MFYFNSNSFLNNVTFLLELPKNENIATPSSPALAALAEGSKLKNESCIILTELTFELGRFFGGLEAVVVLHDYNCEPFKQHNGACIRRNKCQMQRGHLLDLVLNGGPALM